MAQMDQSFHPCGQGDQGSHVHLLVQQDLEVQVALEDPLLGLDSQEILAPPFDQEPQEIPLDLLPHHIPSNQKALSPL